MSFASEQYLKWAESQFEQTGIAANDYARGLTGLANRLRRPFPAANVTAPELNLTQQIEYDSKLMELQNIAINNYIAECESIGHDQAKYNFLQTGIKVK